MDFREAENQDFDGILALQAANLFENLTESERTDGFVTTPFTAQQLEELVERQGLFVADSQGKVWGYTMAAGWDYCAQWPIFPFMIDRLTGRDFAGTNITESSTYQYGPVCVDASLRGTDTFPRLFEIMRIGFAKRYPVGITFINRANPRSHRAHTAKLGMAVIDEFEFSEREYYGLAFETDRSVL